MKYYSQFGEDKYIIENLPIPTVGFFVDIGASDGVFGSNTKAFEDMGWNGICIEPHPASYQKCKTIRKRVVPYAVSDREQERIYYLHRVHPDLSGLKKNKGGFREMTVYTKRLDTIIKEENISTIDLLSIDTEGTELEVLNSFDIRIVRPKIIIVETIAQGIQNPALETYFTSLSDIYKLARSHAANNIYTLR